MTNTLLTEHKIKDIEELAASKLMEAYSEKPFDYSQLMTFLVEREGIRLREADLEEISGVLYKDNQGDWVILVNREDSQKRKLFTIAHELGHYFLHKNDQDQFIDGQFVNSCFGRSESTKYQQQELEANEFAGNLVMPKAQIQEELGLPQQAGELSESVIVKMASKFRVSPHAMLTRLKNLNYGVFRFQ